MKKLMAAILTAGVMSIVMAGTAMAEEATFKFNQSVALPHCTLYPGTYTFTTLNESGLVAVEDENGSRVALFLTIPEEMLKNDGSTSMVLKDGRAQVVRFGQTGQEFQFIYNK